MIDISQGLCQGGGGGKGTETQDWDRQKWKNIKIGSIWSTKPPDTIIFPFSEVVGLKGIQIPVAVPFSSVNILLQTN